MGSLFYFRHFFAFRIDACICLLWISSSVVLHTPISKVLGNSCSVVACNCGALLAVATELLSQQESFPTPLLPQVSSLKYCLNPTTQV